ncbi:MAG: hypothetical protein RL685_5302 [Pseudomonadota bacterium]|jgi:hypothetical protein
MYTFIFVASPVSDEAPAVCRRALERLNDTLPGLGSPGRIEVTELPELSAALGTLLPDVDRPVSLLQQHRGERFSVLTYGERPDTPRLARFVHDVVERSGPTAAALQDGNFSTLLIEPSTRSVWLCGTLLGHRALQYARAGATFLASPHDLALLATGLLPREVDLVSLASMLACDWSLEGRPLLASARRCHPLELVLHRPNGTEVLPLSPVVGARLDARDRDGVARQLESVAEQLEQTASAATAGLERIEAALTAGLDSRALWATLLRAAQGRPLIATTTGAAHSLDVRVARRLARSFGAEHVRREVDSPTADDFSRVLELMAFFAGGDTSGKRALMRAPRMDLRRPFAGGTGGEIFRGFFYPYVGASNAVSLSSEQLADKLLRWRFRRFDKLSFRDAATRPALRQRLLEVLERSRSDATSAHDVLDLFYLLERYGRWGARPACFPWNAVWTPFESTAAIRAALRLPTPRGSVCTVHELLIRRHLPLRAYWTPINAGPFVALQGPGRVRHWLRQGLGMRGLLQQKLERRLQRGSSTPDDLRARILAEELEPVVRGLLQDSGSLSVELLGAAAVDRLLSEHASKRNQLPLLGILLTAEQWWRLARRLHP